MSGKRKQHTIKTTAIADGRGRWATGPARRTHPNLNRAPSRYQPAERCWTFQWLELAAYLALAGLLAGFAFWRIPHGLH